MIGDPLAKTYYEVITVMPGRTPQRKPNGWDKYIQGPLQGRVEASPLGLILKIETDDQQEAFRLRDLIWLNHARWEKTEGRGVLSCEVFETRMVKQSRTIAQPENVLPGHRDSMWKHLPSLAEGVKFNPEWIEEDVRAQEAARIEAVAEEQRLIEARTRYGAASSEHRDRDIADYVAAQAAGETRPFSEWSKTRPTFPRFEDWNRALTSGEEPQLLPPVVDVAPDPEILERTQKEEADRVAKEAYEEAQRRKADPFDFLKTMQRWSEAERSGKKAAKSKSEELYEELLQVIEEEYCGEPLLFEQIEKWMEVEDDIHPLIARGLTEGRIRQDDTGGCPGSC